MNSRVRAPGVLRAVESCALETRHISQWTTPLILGPAEVEEIERVARDVWRAAARAAADITASEPLSGEYEPHLAPFGAVVRAEPDWLRLDVLRGPDGRFRAVEINAACPGGWLLAPLASEEIARELPSGLRPLAPSRELFAGYLMRRFGRRIGIITLGSDYGFEMPQVVDAITALGGEAAVFDPIDPGGLAALAEFAPDGLYWKSDPLRYAESAEVIRGVVEVVPVARHAANPWWQTIGEDKRFLTHVARHTAHVPRTARLGVDPWPLGRESSVLKPAALTRGEGVVVGRDVDDATWEQELTDAAASNDEWVLQEACTTRATRIAEFPHGDLAVLMIGGDVVGMFSRISRSPITNIGKIGALQTVWQSETEVRTDSWVAPADLAMLSAG